jgi:putative membrane protein
MAERDGASEARFDVQLSVGNHFSWFNTRLSVERTFLSWIRTSISLIGFGFTIVQFFQHLQTLEPAASRLHPGAPRDLGLALIASGLGCLIVAALQYRRGLEYLWGPQFRSIAGMDSTAHRSPAMFAAVVLASIGVAALVSVFVKFP